MADLNFQSLDIFCITTLERSRVTIIEQRNMANKSEVLRNKLAELNLTEISCVTI